MWYFLITLFLFSTPSFSDAPKLSQKSFEQTAIKAVNRIEEGDVLKLESKLSQDEEKKLSEKMNGLFAPSSTKENISKRDINLLKITHNASQDLKGNYKDIGFIYEAAFNQIGTHIISITVRTRTNGSLDYGIAASPKSMQPVNNSDASNSHTQKVQILRWIFAALAIFIPLLIFTSAFLCFINRPKRRVLWLIFIFTGFFQINFNWSTGPISFYPLGVIFFGFKINQIDSVGPWILSVSLPLGAVIYLLKWKKARS
jgi:hypothetical protein